MSDVLILVDHIGGSVTKVTSELLTKARSLGNPIAIVVGAAGDAERASESLAQFGAAEVLVAEGEEMLVHPVTPSVDVLAHVVSERSPSAVLIASTARGKEVAGRLAVRLGSGVITDAIDVTADGTTTQSVFGGSTVVEAKVSRGVPVITMRPNATSPEAAPSTPAVTAISVALSASSSAAKVSDRQPAVKGGRPELTEAAIVVSGGRGTNGDFAPVEDFADQLGAAVGASRAATDAGWYPHTLQVGQTGKTVSPNLYVACGISGAIQHRAGMQTSKTIVAINKDPEAPIFEIADFGVIGDLFAVLPQATDGVKARKG
jgi:electron transfer flavoprotein alpha subunit